MCNTTFTFRVAPQYMMQQVALGLLLHPLSKADAAVLAEPLPEPMYPGAVRQCAHYRNCAHYIDYYYIIIHYYYIDLEMGVTAMKGYCPCRSPCTQAKEGACVA